MKQMILLAGAVALGFAAPAMAKPGNGHGHGQGYAYAYGAEGAEGYYGNVKGAVGYGAGGCPPGLTKKAVPCVPPGQAKKLYNGQRVTNGYANPYGYRTPYGYGSPYGSYSASPYTASPYGYAAPYGYYRP